MTERFVCLRCGREYERYYRSCSWCFETRSMVPLPARRVAQVTSAAKVATAAELAAASWNEVRVGALPGVRFGVGALALFTGPPSAGKTTLGVRALASVSGPVVMLSAELGLGPSLSSMLSRLGVRRSDLTVLSRGSADDVARVVAQVRAVALLVDSVQVAGLEAADLRALLALPSLRLLIGISQVTKGGSMRGSRELEHEADVILSCEQLWWQLTKSRYQALDQSGSCMEVPHGEVEAVSAGR